MDTSQPQSQENESMPSAITKEEHFITEEDVVENPNAVYIEDNPQKALEKLINLNTNENFYERIQYINHLAELLESIGEPGYIHLKIIISFIHEDKVDTKRDYLAQVTPILYQLQKRGQQGYKDVVNVMLPSIYSLLHTAHYDVKEKSAQQMTVIASILTQEDREKHLLPQILTVGHDHKNEENRMIGARMLNQMAPYFGKDICEHIIGAELLAMMEDIEFGVRKEAVYYLPYTAKVVSTRFFGQKLLPIYFKLCKDSNWEVRLACVQIIYDMSSLCVEEFTSIKEKGLTELMLAFTKDANQFVKISAYKTLGHFISTLQGLKVNEKLVDYYLRMTEKSINGLEPNDEIMYACAYSFPAVVLTLGLPKWKTLRKLFKTLIKGESKIRKPLACALHEIAKVIGEAKTEKYLLPVLIAFLKDPNEGVKHGAVKNLASFFEVFSVDKRENMIDILVDLLKNQIEWRIRELIARQIEKFTHIFSPEITFRIIAPLSFKLCNDPVAFVREEAVKKIHALFTAKYKTGEKHRQSIIENIRAFSQSNRFSTRQSFVLMCEKLMKDPEAFKVYFIDSFIPLGQDKVSNVRLTVAKALQKLFKESNQLCSDPQIITLVRKLKRDSCADVKKLMQSIVVSGDSLQGGLSELDLESTLLDDSKILESKDRIKSIGSRLEKAKILAKLGKTKEKEVC